jgi:hypothetical protein
MQALAHSQRSTVRAGLAIAQRCPRGIGGPPMISIHIGQRPMPHQPFPPFRKATKNNLTMNERSFIFPDPLYVAPSTRPSLRPALPNPRRRRRLLR